MIIAAVLIPIGKKTQKKNTHTKKKTTTTGQRRCSNDVIPIELAASLKASGHIITTLYSPPPPLCPRPSFVFTSNFSPFFFYPLSPTLLENRVMLPEKDYSSSTGSVLLNLTSRDDVSVSVFTRDFS